MDMAEQEGPHLVLRHRGVAQACPKRRQWYGVVVPDLVLASSEAVPRNNGLAMQRSGSGGVRAVEAPFPRLTALVKEEDRLASDPDRALCRDPCILKLVEMEEYLAYSLGDIDRLVHYQPPVCHPL